MTNIISTMPLMKNGKLVPGIPLNISTKSVGPFQGVMNKKIKTKTNKKLRKGVKRKKKKLKIKVRAVVRN